MSSRPVAAAAAPPGPSLQDVLAALQSPDDDESRDDAAAADARNGGFDDVGDDVSPTKFLAGLFDDVVDHHPEDPYHPSTADDASRSGLDPGTTGAVAASLWDDSVALSFPSSSSAQQPPPELVASSTSTSTNINAAVHADDNADDSSQLDILGADEIEQLATGMLDMGSPTASAAAAAGGVVDIAEHDGGAGSSMMSRMRMASSWHLGPGANAKSKGRQEDTAAGSDANGGTSSTSRRILPVRKTRSSSGVEYDDAAAATTARRSSGESVASVASVTSADGKPGKQIVVSGETSSGSASPSADGNVTKKRKKSSTGSSAGGGGGGSGSGNKKNTAKNTKKKADAIAKKAAENLGLDPSTVPQRPKQAANTFLLFCKSNRSRIKAENPDAKNSQMNTLLGEQWKKLSDRARQPYVDAAAEAAKEYAIKLEAYNTSMARFRKTDDGKRWIDEQDRLLRQSVEKGGGAWDASMGIATDEKEKEAKAIAAVVAAAAAVKAQENRKLESKAALERAEEEKMEKDRQLFSKAHMTLPPAPDKPKSAFSFFSDALYEKRGLRQQQQQQQQNLQFVTPTSVDDSACPAMLYGQLPQEQKVLYETMASKAQTAYRKTMKEYERDLEAARSRARDVIDMLDPVKRAVKVDQMISEVAAVRKRMRNSGDDEWFQPDRQRLVRHQLDWRLRHAAKSGCTQADFARNLTKLYTAEGQNQADEKRRQEEFRLAQQKVEQERRMAAEAEKVKQLQEQMQRVHQLQQLQQMQAAKQAMAYPGQAYSQQYYPTYPWEVMLPTQMAQAYSYAQTAVSRHPQPAVSSNRQALNPLKPTQPLPARSLSSQVTGTNPMSAPVDATAASCPLMALAELAESHLAGSTPAPEKVPSSKSDATASTT